jgi:hypothetical protein
MLGRTDEALAAFRAALAAERSQPNVHTLAYLGFAELVLAHDRRELYPEALATLDEFGTDEVFPATQYRSAASRALLHEALGDPTRARQCAALALAAAAKTESPFRYHRKLGLVESADSKLQAQLQRLARGG